MMARPASSSSTHWCPPRDASPQLMQPRVRAETSSPVLPSFCSACQSSWCRWSSSPCRPASATAARASSVSGRCPVISRKTSGPNSRSVAVSASTPGRTSPRLDAALPERGDRRAAAGEEPGPEVRRAALVGDRRGQQLGEHRALGAGVEPADQPHLLGEVPGRRTGVGKRDGVGHLPAERLGGDRGARGPVLVERGLADARTGPRWRRSSRRAARPRRAGRGSRSTAASCTLMLRGFTGPGEQGRAVVRPRPTRPGAARGHLRPPR